ncbi:F-actin-capping protein subunit alpha [Neopestalotiopsis sp. 37M]|nr:F-actin-capping protein subunit alpha [Neopestalotiopsis sp. 37M]
MNCGWINIEMRAFNHVDKFLGYAQYFGNKLIQEYKDTDKKHLEWVESYYQIFRELSKLLKNHFAFGVEWVVKM